MKKNIWKQCKSKKRYRNEHDVNQYRKKYERERGIKLDYYYCVHCKGYHLTSSPSFLELGFPQRNDRVRKADIYERLVKTLNLRYLIPVPKPLQKVFGNDGMTF